ncbi:MAG: phenylacetaldoxime dehydratase family protein [Methylophilus sp.]|uniref:phenylacetaldoxime dehydratase family protein n=1 Tax=Methylophilus sp. TaxID=29541 RepID=UPI003F9EBF48
MEEGYEPAFPMWAARAGTDLKQVVMGYFGVQFSKQELHGKACAVLGQYLRSFAVANGPQHYDITQFKDAANFENMIVIAYWDSPEKYTQWQANAEIEDWWQSDERLKDELGYFREILMPRVENFETAFSTPDSLEGIGVVMGDISGEIQEHGYWGSMRDRLPSAQTDALVTKESLAAGAVFDQSKQRIKLAGHENLAVIRSGQNWIATEGKERALYLNEMEPTLRKGMDFLHHDGLEIGCYTNRYMRHADSKGQILEKSFGVSFWRSLADLEHWSKSHPTHLAIFGTFIRIVQELESELNLRLYHEVSVLKADEQSYEYINCHPNTGLLNGLNEIAA